MGPHSGTVTSWIGSRTRSLTTPAQNAYSTELGIDPSPLMAVDLMHDHEFGTGKAVIIHGLRLLLAAGDGLIQEFDARSVLSVLGSNSFI